MRLFMNRVIVSGYLTRDPQLQRSDSKITVCRIRIACPSRRRDRASGRWRSTPNYFDVAIFDEEGEEVARLTAKGSWIAVDGRLNWSEWQGRDGRRTQSVSIIADTVHLMDDSPAGGADRAGRQMGSRGAGDPVAARDASPRDVGAGRHGLGAGTDGLGAGRHGLGAGPHSLGAGPDGLGAGPDGAGAGPDGLGATPDEGELDFDLFGAETAAVAKSGAGAARDPDAGGEGGEDAPGATG